MKKKPKPTAKRKREPYSKGFCASAMTFYAVTYAEIRDVAQKHGYALALHGSLVRDLDVIAVPWVHNASEPFELAKAICEDVGGFIVPDSKGESNPTAKPYGRLAWSIHFGGASKVAGSGRYIDLSVTSKDGLPKEVSTAIKEDAITMLNYADRLRQIAEIMQVAKDRASHSTKRCMADFIFENDAQEIYRLAKGKS